MCINHGSKQGWQWETAAGMGKAGGGGGDFYFRHKFCINCGLKEGSVWESVVQRGQKGKMISIASIFIEV